MKFDFSEIKKTVLKHVLEYTKEVTKNLKHMPNGSYIGLGKPQHKLSPTEVVLFRVALAAVVAGIEIALEQ